MNFIVLVVSLVIALWRPKFAFWLLVGIVIAYPQYLLNPAYNQDVDWLSEGGLPVAMIQFGLSLGIFLPAWRRSTPRVRRFFIPIALMAIVYGVVGLLRGNWVNYVFMETAPLLSYVTLLATVCVVRTDNDLHYALRFVLVLCALASAGAIMEYVLGVGVTQRYYLEGRSAKGQIGALIGNTLIFCSYVYPELKRRIGFSTALVFLFGLINIVSAIVTINRMMLICYSLVVIFLVLRVFASGKLSPILLLVLVAISIIIPILAQFYQLNPALLGRFSEVPNELDPYRAYEYSLLENLLSGPDYLIFGGGAGTEWYLVGTDYSTFGNHNFYVQLAWKFGLFGVLLFLLACIFFFRDALRRSQLLAQHAYRGVAVWAYFSLFLFLVMAVTQNRFLSSKHVAFVGLLLGLPFALEQLALQSKSAVLDKSLDGTAHGDSLNVFHRGGRQTHPVTRPQLTDTELAL